jgi:glycine/D-amino acid oxidase-like deaminating enzyme
MTDQPDTVIIGGGIIGCVAAFRLAEDSERDVLVLEQNQIAGEASGLSAGLVAPSLYFSDWPDVAHFAHDFFEAFDGTGEFTFTRRSRLDFCRADEEAFYRERAERLADRGFSVGYLTAEAVESRYERLDMREYAGANEHRDSGWVDPYSLTTTLKDRAADRGVEFQTGVSVEKVEVTDGAVAGVRTGDGTIDATSVVAAAGWRTKLLLEDFLPLPVRPYKTPCVVLDPGRDLGEEFPLGRISDDQYLYFRPEHNGDLLVGGGEMPVVNPEMASTGIDVDSEFEHYLASKLPQFIRDAGEMRVVDSWAGVDGATPDGRAIIDAPVEAPNGLVVATGFNGLGIMCSPVAGELVRAFVTGDEPAVQARPFRLSRFENASTDFEFQGLHHNV